MENILEKYRFLYTIQAGKCAISFKPIPTYEASKVFFGDKVDFHHRLHRTKWRVKKYPLFIDSILNLCLVFNSAHIVNPSAMPLTDRQAENAEKVLSSNFQIAKWALKPFILGSVEYTIGSIKDIMECIE